MPQNYVVREDRPPRGWVPPVKPKPPIEPPGDMTFIRFHHGLGDCTLFAHAMKLWTSRGYPIGICCAKDKEPLFKAAGCEIVISGAHHAYPHPNGLADDQNDWSHSKIGWNLRYPLPYIGDDADLWDELCSVRLSLEPYITDDDRAEVDRFLATVPGPVITLHTHGNTAQGKNFPHGLDVSVTHELVRQTDATILLLDFDHRVGKVPSHRVRHLGDDWHNLSVTELAYLMNHAVLHVGVDSGPLHFTRFTNVPALGVWFKHFPSYFALPHPRAAHLCTSDGNHLFHHPLERIVKRRVGYNLIDGQLTAENIARQAARVLAGAVGPDLLLAHLLDKTRVQADRHLCRDRDKTFRAVFDYLGTQTRPGVIETGCIRESEDYGAGYSTYLFGAFLKTHGGHIHSVDLNGQNVEFARKATKGLPVTVHQGDSVEFLGKVVKAGRRVPLVYLDSLDSDQPGHAEHGLAEATLAVQIVRPDGRILIDDSPWSSGWTGKGRLAIPWLISQGWKLDPVSGYQALLRGPDAS